MAELDDALAVLAAHPNAEEVVTGLKAKAGGVHQGIYQQGFNVGYGKNAGELSAAQSKVTELTGQVASVTTERDDARKTNPDVSKIHADWQGKLDDQARAHTAELDKARGVVSTTALQRAQADLVGELVAQGVKRIHAEAIAERRIVQDRLKPDPATGEVSIYQAGTQIPLAPTDGKSAVQLLASELKSTASADMLSSNADAGAGGTTPGAGGAGSAEFQKIRDAVKTESEKTQPVAPHGAFRGLAQP